MIFLLIGITHISTRAEDKINIKTLYGHISHPIPIKKKGQKIAVRIISQFGEETTKVLQV